MNQTCHMFCIQITRQTASNTDYFDLHFCYQSSENGELFLVEFFQKRNLTLCQFPSQTYSITIILAESNDSMS